MFYDRKVGDMAKQKVGVIKAVPVPGGFIAVAKNGEKPLEGFIHRSKDMCYDALDTMYHGSAWNGRLTKSGYKIDLGAK